MIKELTARFGSRLEHIDSSRWSNIYVVGDVHGCTGEFNRLLEKIDLAEDELVICVGDVIRKGPDSPGILQRIRSASNIISILGNSEVKYLRRDSHIPGLRKSDRAYMHRWPLIVCWDENVVVHGGIHPHRDVSDYTVRDVLYTRSLKEGDRYESPYWFEEYDGKERIFFGHTVTRRPILRPNAIGLDTGCVYGGCLTAYDCARERCISVESDKMYRTRSSKNYYDPG